MKEIVCYCKNISIREIEIAVSNGAASLEEIKSVTGACTGNNCKLMNPEGRCCSADILRILRKQDGALKDTGC